MQNEVLRFLAEKNMHTTFTGTAVGHSCHPVVQLGPVSRGHVSIRLLHLGSLDGRERSLPTILQIQLIHGVVWVRQTSVTSFLFVLMK